MKLFSDLSPAITFFIVAIVTLIISSDADGHEVRPAYLRLAETADNIFDITWKQPLLNDKRMRLNPVLPTDCVMTTPMLDELLPGALIRTWQVRCAEDAFEQQPLLIAGLSSSLTDVWVVFDPATIGRKETSALLTASTPSIWLRQNSRTNLAAYFSLGTQHLLSGADHLLFVFGLMFFVVGFPGLLKTITAFTIAHSITLAAATLQFVRLSQGPVEACIVLSILFLAVEASASNRKRTLTARMPWLIAFIFGLLHGFGFAGALQDIGLPTEATALALLLFNLGIEFGQIVFIVFLLSLKYAASRWITPIPRWLAQAPVYAMGTLSSYWLLMRLWTDWQPGTL